VILLLGGTSETAPLALALAKAGHTVLVSTATDIRLNTGEHPAVRRRSGRLDEQALTGLLRSEKVAVIVDATHPYAVEVRRTACRVATQLQLRYLAFVRPSGLQGGEDVLHASSHEEAAHLAFGLGRAVLLTTGSRNLAPYAHAARLAGQPLVARVLDDPDSFAACQRAGLPEHAVVSGRGPFSVGQNRELIRRFGIGALVTKDSGAPGGLAAKLEAAAQEGCQVVVVDRPNLDLPFAVASIADIVRAVGAP
jgi:precorrin-6A/cobalt-precorrin-6A reductase